MCESKEYKKYLNLINETNYYKVLGLKDFSSLEEITKEYRSLAKKLHPDMYPTATDQEKKEINQVFQKVGHVFNELKDLDKKKAYDSELSLQNSKSQVKINVPEIKTQANTPYKDPRVKEGGFTFNKFESVDLDKIKAEKEAKDREIADSKFNEAKKLFQNKDYDHAINILRELTERFSKVAEYHSYLGLAMLEKGWHGYAQAEFKVALHFDPKDKIALENYKAPEKKPEEKMSVREQASITSRFKSFFKK
ncbi:MAG: DnaJ domain-containing protein [Candidatus Sericytochromatia bacterium]